MRPYITLITLAVKDVKRSREFYEGVLHFPVKADLGSFVAYEMNNIVFALYPRDALAKDIRIEDSKPGFSGITLAHNVATREEVLEIIETVRKAGCRIVKEPQKVDWGDNTGAYFADPDGHLWEITDLGAGYLEHVPSDPSVKKRQTV
jgi:catechol 2,3-dioxygenase-like lactoylglutathione lyase family enzyme